MAKWIIRTNYGYGDSYEVVEAESRDDADTIAYDTWREAVESNADYGTLEYNEENCGDYDLEWDGGEE